MALKKYNGRKKGERAAEHEITGWILAIISGFLLLCAVVPIILGPISGAVYAFLLGVFGFSAYPLLLAALVLGIFLIQGRELSVPKLYAVCTAVLSLLVIFILHLATTYSIVNKPFGEYSLEVYNAPSAGGMFTAGGIVFGTFVYGIQALLTPVFSFVVFSLAAAGIVFLMLNRRFGFVKRFSRQSKEAGIQFEKSNRKPAPVKPVSDYSLYVEKIMPPKIQKPYESESGTFSQLNTPSASGVSAHTSYSLPPEGTDGKEKVSARAILFGDTQKILPPSAVYPFAPGIILPAPLVAAPDIKEPETPQKPPKIVHVADYAGFGLPPPVPMLPEKDVSGKYVLGTIVNGEELSQRLAESNRPYQSAAPAVRASAEPLPVLQPKTAETSALPVQRPDPVIDPKNYDSAYTQYDGFIMRKIEPVKISPKKDYFTANRFDEPAPASAQIPVPRADEFEKPAEMPIINGDSFGFSELKAFEPKAFEPERLGFSDSLVNDFPLAEDLSETRVPGFSDHSGYYTAVEDEPAPGPEAFVPPIKESRSKSVPRALKPENQIKFENYLETAAKQEPAVPKTRRCPARYEPPPIDLLLSSKNVSSEDAEADIHGRAALLEQTLDGLKLPAKVSAITRGPSVTRYELEMPHGIPIKKIEQYVTDIEYYLASNGKIRLETPIPGKRAVGIEVPNEKIDIVGLKDIIQSNEFHKSSSHLTLALGKDIAGASIVCELDRMPHLLIAGATGSGKSACLNSVIMSLIYKSSPEDVRLILIDPKHVEFTVYKGLPHLLTGEIINDGQQALNAFKWLKNEMDRRYILFAKNLVRNLPEFNKCPAVKSGEEEKMAHIVLIVDELAELMLAQNRKDLEEKIMSMAQKARAAGIHLILATQRPSVDVITGTIKANLPSRIAFSVKSVIDSRTILDSAGAETLLGRGDMLYAPIGVDDPRRVQGAYVTNEEVTTVIEYVKEHNEAAFDEAFREAITIREETPAVQEKAEEDDSGFDALMPSVLKIVIQTGTASTSFIQRRFSVGYARAARIIDQMEQSQFIGPIENGRRSVFITREKYYELFGEMPD